MKGKLEFNLDNIDERKAFLAAAKATDMAVVLFQITHNLKRRLENYTEDKEEEFQIHNIINKTFEEINILLDKYGIIIDDITE